ncbi:MAG: SMP-30/gluconolactonase/LRE family protein [Gammaproteobacteria bacterium]|nr:SMP-30/gluconolactonase/LRE family protein [Gammaproteobacteria bacterium]
MKPTSVLLALTALSCGTEAAVAASCEPQGAMAFVCDTPNAEDLIRVGASRWLIASGMSGEGIAGRLHLIDAETRTRSMLFPGDTPAQRHDRAMFPACPGPIDAGDFSAHGLDLLAVATKQYRLYVVGHGAREAIEVFDLDARGATPSVTWVGCVPMPATAMMNSIAVLPDGSFVATEMYSAVERNAFALVAAGEVSGRVYFWRPGAAPVVVPGTELSGPNGLAFSADGEHLFIAVYGSREVRRYRRGGTSWSDGVVQDGVLRVNFSPDNLRWASDGTLLGTGHRGAAANTCGTPPCSGGWGVVAIEPKALTARTLADFDGAAPFQNATVAVRVGDVLWIGTYRGDRVLALSLNPR